MYLYTVLSFSFSLLFFFFFFLEKRKKRTAEGDTSFHRIGQQQVILTRSEIIFFPLDLFVSRLSKEYFGRRRITKESRTKKTRDKKVRTVPYLIYPTSYERANGRLPSLSFSLSPGVVLPSSSCPCSSIFLGQVIVGSWKFAWHAQTSVGNALRRIQISRIVGLPRERVAHSCGQFESFESFLALVVVEIGGGQKNEAKCVTVLEFGAIGSVYQPTV